MSVRMPSAAVYETQVAKEQQWLPKLAPHLPLPIPVPLAVGEADENYPFVWSVRGWLDGEAASLERIRDLCEFAASLAQFLVALQHIDASVGPVPGPHNFFRGGSLATYDAETRQAIAALENRIDVHAVTEVWNAALASAWSGLPVWIHGDMGAGNLLVHESRLSAVIDFGQLGVGDPACDLAIAWTLFARKSREVFYAALPLDAGTWARGRGWTLWKALIVAAGFANTNAMREAQALHVIDEICLDHERRA